MNWMPYIYIALAVIIVMTIALNYKRVILGSAVLRKFYHEVLLEMKRVSWPTKDEVVGSTIIVGITTLILLVIIGTADTIFGRIVLTIFKFK